VRDINIHKLHPLPDFLHSGTGYIENSRVSSIIDFFADSSHNFSERALLVLKNTITISITIFCTVEHSLTLHAACCTSVSETIDIGNPDERGIRLSKTLSIALIHSHKIGHISIFSLFHRMTVKEHHVLCLLFFI